MDPVSELCEAYRSSEQIDLVLGAGVSKSSGVPLYLEMVLMLAGRASAAGLMPAAPAGAVAFLEAQLERLRDPDTPAGAITLRPEEVALFVKQYLAGDADLVLKEIVQAVLYEKVKPASRQLVSRATYKQNATLDSLIRFCAALPGAGGASRGRGIEPNPKVHAILTTNYDCLLEACFSTKFRYLLKPVGREGSRATRKGQRLIPVYHVHGYLSIFSEAGGRDDRPSPPLVIAENDYFRTFYNPYGFTDSVAAKFFRERTCLFIGSSMIDMNLRRFLFYAASEDRPPAGLPDHFAILHRGDALEDAFRESVLLSYGVKTIWIDRYGKIDGILGRVYGSAAGMDPDNWEALRAVERS